MLPDIDVIYRRIILMSGSSLLFQLCLTRSTQQNYVCVCHGEAYWKLLHVGTRNCLIDRHFKDAKNNRKQKVVSKEKHVNT